jgi:predicted transcriptional regulator
MGRKLKDRRSTSRLPPLVDYVMSQPIVSAGVIAAELGVTQRAAQSLVAELGLRETTGRGRYRAGAVL